MYFPVSKADTVFVEFEIKGKNNSKLWGYSLCRFNAGNFVKASITGKYDSIKNEVYFTEKNIVEKRMAEYIPVFLDEYYLNFDAKGNLTGMVRCIVLADHKSDVRMPCHQDMYIDLVRQ